MHLDDRGLQDRPVAAGERTVVVHAREVRVRETGDASGSPVVLVHGIGRSLADWDAQHALLADGHRVISLDLPGFGFSQAPDGPVSLGSSAAALWGALDALGEERPAHLVGNSLGGAVVMRAAADAPGRAASLVLADPAGFSRGVTPALRAVAVPGVGRWLLSRSDAQTLRRTERSLFVDPALVTDERLAHAAAVAVRPERLRVFAEAAGELGTAFGVRGPWRRELLGRVARLELPTLVVWGERDLILPVSGLAEARRAFPWAQTHVFAQTGHMPQIERAEEFARLVRGLVDAVDRDS
ncbi:alpha/beta fold hydrolase [Cellulomonas sp. PhB143]|uniref:alpha/beta fold hydrolase n=1 Tax=Cellulomonas sp. PhB143 TaxID=2485186 RepID=UPI000F46664E|nr:alpha/beta fold hydrolase [Cellulomonas sp. PhB143]ROS75360.1 pimeloyl-ACP methyl ester carboxylesterase [Cellulomonas sp. PhB143]